MGIPQEIKEKYNIEEDDLKAIDSSYGNIYAEKLLEIKTQTSANIDKGINNAIVPLATELGFRDRDKGEKIADYNQNFNEFYKGKLESEKSSILQSENKVIEQYKEEITGYKQKLANYDELVGYKDKYNEQSLEISETRRKAAFTDAFADIKSKVDPKADEWGVKSRFSNVEKDINSKFDIKNVEGEWVAVDKENEFKVTPLKDLVNSYEYLKDIIAKPRSQKGISTGNGADLVESNLPFDVLKGESYASVCAKAGHYLRASGLNPWETEFKTKYDKLTKQAKEITK